MADDEDDDSSGEESFVGGSSSNDPVMKGTLSVAEGRLWWVGRWALNEDLYHSSTSSKFKYGGPSATDLASPVSGSWNGYFMNPEDGEMTKVREKGVVITFGKEDEGVLEVSGSGTNDFGDFTLKGTYVVETKALSLSKHYPSLPSRDDDDDDLDEDAIDDDYADELAGLKEEQDMPIEELAKRYQAYADDDDSSPPRKKQK